MSRKRELSQLWSNAKLFSLSSLSYNVVPVLTTIAVFAVYTFASPDQILDAKKLFVSLSLFNAIRDPMEIFPRVLMENIAMMVSLRRIQDFLNSPQADQDKIKTKSSDKITIENCQFRWRQESESFTLTVPELTIPRGSLMVVVGKVGAGKSSLISAMLGGMLKTNDNGLMQVPESVAYVPQESWILNRTFKKNVLMNKSDSIVYNLALKLCQLDHDLKGT